MQTSGPTGVTAVGAGAFHSVALKSDGTVWAWGYNDDGELGDDSWVEQRTPVLPLRRPPTSADRKPRTD